MFDGIIKNNPVLVMMLGLCATLGTTGTVKDSMGMGIATSIVLILSSVSVSFMRKLISPETRVLTLIVISSTYTAVADHLMKTYFLDLHSRLGIFVPLIAVNGLILARTENYALKNSVLNAAVDSLNMSLGFILVLSALGTVREILGYGTFLGFPLFGGVAQRSPISFMVLPSGAFLTFALLKALMNKYLSKTGKDKK